MPALRSLPGATLSVPGWLLLALTLSPAPAVAQELPFLPEAQTAYLAGEISGDAAYEHIRYFTQFHRPRGGASGLMRVAEYIESKAREYGLENVKLIRQRADNAPWQARSASLWMVEPEIRLLADLQQTPIRLADYSRSADGTAEVVDVGAGLAESDYAKRDVRGRIVLAHGGAAGVMEQAVWKRGALGVILFPDPEGMEYPLNSLNYPDQIRWNSLPAENREKQPPTFAFVLSQREGRTLRAQLQKAGPAVKVHAEVEADYGGEPWQVMVEAFITGAEIRDQDIVLTGHLQEEKFSANDDASGSANTLEVARALAKLVRDGRIPRPRRNIRFWWTTEISSERQFFADHPEEVAKMMANINQDMVGANQSQDVMRVQNVTQVPFSRSHYLTAVAETVIRYLVQTNTPQLAIAQAGGSATAPKPIYATLGTRQRYNAAIIPFHNNTDHMTFTEAPIGIPGITFTNWPDNYIHTSDDDLWNIDRTQLQRNAFAVATMAYVLAAASDATAPALAAATYQAALSHLAKDSDVALQLILQAGGNIDGAYHEARSQIREGAKRERRALESVAATGSPGGPGARLARTLIEAVDRQERAMIENLAGMVLSVHGTTPASEPALTALEKTLSQKTPSLIAGPAEFLTKRDKVQGVEGLHPLMAFEVMNFIDGRRTAFDIFAAVRAEARHAGSFYYGNVRAEMVDQYLLHLAKAGLVRY